jgi:peptide/nickel transport system substrate-binding protein
MSQITDDILVTVARRRHLYEGGISMKVVSVRRRALRARTVAGLIVPVGLVSSLLAGLTTTPAAAATGSMVVDLAGGSGTVDPAQACGLYDVDFTGQFYARLTQYGFSKGPAGTTQFDPAVIQPWLAKSWTVSPNGRTYTFHLVPGAEFANGDPLNASAVVYSLERSINTGGCGQYFILDGITSPQLVKTITAPNSTTVVINLSQADGNFPQDLAQPGAGIVDPKIVQANGGVVPNKVNTWMQSHIAGGSGPYMLENYVPGESATLIANPHYFSAAPLEHQILVKFISDDATLLLRARSGEADVTLGLSPQSVHSLAGSGSTKIVVNPTTTSLQIMIPSNHYPMSKVDFRAALSYALPYQQILQKLGYGYGQLFYGPYPPLLSPAYDKAMEQPRAFDVTKAKDLMKASGVKLPVKVSLIIDGSVPLEQQLATVVQSYWSQIGVDVTVKTLTDAEFETTINTNPKPYQMGITEDGPGVIDAGYYLGYDMLCTSAFNAAGICVPGADSIYYAARSALSESQRVADYHKIIPLWTANSPKIPVYAIDSLTVLSPRVKTYSYSLETEMWRWGL